MYSILEAWVSTIFIPVTEHAKFINPLCFLDLEKNTPLQGKSISMWIWDHALQDKEK
jgi:hypothetical protein